MEFIHSLRLIAEGSVPTQAAGIGLAALAGVAAAAALSWTLLLPDPAPAYRPLPRVARVSVSISTAHPLPPALIVVLPARPDQPQAIATTAVPASAGPATTLPIPADPRLKLAAALDEAWGNDTPQTVRLLDDFLQRFPNDESAIDKLYAALLARADEQVEQNAVEDAVALLARAEDLLPGRAEAYLAQLELTSRQ